MYTGIVCLVLFDARGRLTEPYGMAVCILAVIMLGIKHTPTVFHRQRQVDAFCEDLLYIYTHVLMIASIPDTNHLRYACGLQCTCFVLQHRFLKKGPAILVHTITALWLIAAYVYGPRVSELRTFIAAVVCPHALDLLAGVLIQVQKFTTLYIMEI